jgi:hypothetical protein
MHIKTKIVQAPLFALLALLGSLPGVAMPDPPVATQGDDLHAPFILSRSPGKNATAVALNAAVEAIIIDAGSGVDSTSVRVSVNGTDITSRLQWKRYADQNGTGYLVRYRSTGYFNFGEAVTVTITAADGAVRPNLMTEQYGFRCLEDTAPPELVRRFPVQYAFANTPIVLALRDAQSGVDAASVHLTVNGVKVNGLAFDVQDTLLIVSWLPSPWHKLNSVVSVEYSASDFLGNSGQGHFTFWVDPDYVAPVIAVEPPAGRSGSHSATDSIRVAITDIGLGIEPGSLRFEIDGRNLLQRCSLAPLSATGRADSSGYRLKFPLTDFPPGKSLTCRLRAQDAATPANRLDTTFVVQMAIRPESVAIVPPLITPNGDGINDRMQVFADLGGIPERIRIYSLDNELVRELDVRPGNQNVMAEWDGRDRNNRIVANGVYIVQLCTEAKSYQCTITVAR